MYYPIFKKEDIYSGMASLHMDYKIPISASFLNISSSSFIIILLSVILLVVIIWLWLPSSPTSSCGQDSITEIDYPITKNV